MKIIRATILAAALAGAMGSTPVLARGGHHHGHARFGFFIGAPLLLAPWHYGPRYYYSPAVVVPSSPVYIEQGEAVAPAPELQSWYYCRESQTYYPYVKECAGPWQRVAPQPPS